MAGNESAAHQGLKRLALAWAQRHGFRIAAAEVSVASLGGMRLDAAAYRAEFTQQNDAVTKRSVKMPCLGATAVFECKSSRADFLKDSRCEERIAQRLRKLHEQRALYENSMQQYFPTLRHGETLFPEFDVYSFEAAGFEPYEKILAEIRSLSRRLHAQTKFDKLLRWKAANVHYVVAEPDIVRPHELPAGWGLLVRNDAALDLVVKAVWQEASEHSRWQLLLRIALCGTRAINKHHAIDALTFENILPEGQKGVFS